MWIASTYGFFSIVKKDGGWHVRARKQSDLELLKSALGKADIPIYSTPEADYCARIFVEDSPAGSKQMEALFGALQTSITYPNFKSEVGRLVVGPLKLVQIG